jgi:Protein of unknown function (DUF1579)
LPSGNRFFALPDISRLVRLRPLRIFGAAVAVLVWSPTASSAQDYPKPVPEHEWLQQFVGEWDADTEMYMEPGKPPQRLKATESTRTLGGFWVIAEGKGAYLDQPYASILTLGYDTQKKKYLGTFIDSTLGYLWKYEGTVDPAGKILTLETEGPHPGVPGKLSRFRELTEFKSKDHRVFTSSVEGEDGKWLNLVNINYQRKGSIGQ